jgi:hypothetical protein
MPHINMVDYVPWPAFRELTVQIPAMQERMEWLLDMSNTLRCDWSFAAEEAFLNTNEANFLDLCDLAKVRLQSSSTKCTRITFSTLTIYRQPFVTYQIGLSDPQSEAT